VQKILQNRNSKGKQEKPVRRRTEDEKELSAVPPSVKYKEHFNESIVYHLPSNLLHLLYLFEQLDLTINLFLNANRVLLLPELIKSLQDTKRVSFNQQDFRQILYFKPNLYELSWQRHSFSNLLEIVLAIPNHENTLCTSRHHTLKESVLIQRKTALRNKMVEFVFRKHEEFLGRAGLRSDLSYGERKGWHPRFEFEEIKDIPMLDLPARPLKNSTKVMREFLGETSNSHTQGVENIFSSSFKSQRKEEEEVSSKQTIGDQSTLDTIKESTKGSESHSEMRLELIRLMKEKEEKLRAADLDRRRLGNRMMFEEEEMKTMVHSLRTYYTNRKVSNMFQANVVDQLFKSNVLGNASSKAEILTKLEYMCSISLGWLERVKNEESTIIRMNNKVPISSVLQEISNTCHPVV
jgi:ASC-1-like (ASCH) protein